ncbi:MAG: RNA polymerase sigma factor [Lachnospiraceae bacterium]|nr:RNA polymerase sigma factor [Lachnospiraceae bacterium]
MYDEEEKLNSRPERTEKPDDQELVQRFFSRDESVLEAVLQKHGSLLRRLAARFLSDSRDCEETVSDVLLAAWNAIPPQRPENLPAFLVTLTRRAAISRLRGLTRAKDVPAEHLLALEELEDVLPDRSGVEDALLAGELAASIEDFLRGLPPRRRTVFLFRYYASCSVDEISSRLFVSRSTVEKELQKARRDLKAKLEKEGYTV